MLLMSRARLWNARAAWGFDEAAASTGRVRGDGVMATARLRGDGVENLSLVLW